MKNMLPAKGRKSSFCTMDDKIKSGSNAAREGQKKMEKI
jgi:hypothetical protein